MLSTVGLVILDGAARLSATGEYDFFNAHVLRRAVHDAATETAGDVCLDISAVTFLDLCAAHAIVCEHRRLEQAGRGVKLLGTNPAIRRLLAAMDVDIELCA